MSYEVKLLTDDPVIMTVWYADFKLKTELVPMSEEMREVLDSSPEPLYLIADMSAARLGLEDLIAGANFAVQGEEPIFKHPNITQVILISQSKAIELTAKGMRAATFGNMHIKVAASLEDALKIVRS